MDLLGWVIIGLLAGAIAKLIMPGRDPGGCIVTILLGIAGALLAGFVGLLCAPALRPSPGRTGWLMLYGFLNGGLFLLLLNLALFMATNVGALAIAGQLSVPFSLLLGALLLGERLSTGQMLSFGLIWIGLILFASDGIAAARRRRPAAA